MRFEVVHGDATALGGDVLALKFAQGQYGLDFKVAQLLANAGEDPKQAIPPPGAFAVLQAPPGLLVSHVLFVGVEPLPSFGYPEIRVFARRVLESLASGLPDTRRVLVTVHGPYYGLDEIEAFESELAGFLDAVQAGTMPAQLATVTFVEIDRGRATRLGDRLEALLGGRDVEPGRALRHHDLAPDMRDRLSDAGNTASAKPHVFVAMPFERQMEDVFHYGIQNAAHSANLLCERVDRSSFTGDVMDRVRSRIETARWVIADLTGANANVYLEVGYAWGCQVPTILIAQDASDLSFDVRGQRCLIYNQIKDLEEKLAHELGGLAGAASGPSA
jgi:hypothetical protein